MNDLDAKMGELATLISERYRPELGDLRHGLHNLVLAAMTATRQGTINGEPVERLNRLIDYIKELGS